MEHNWHLAAVTHKEKEGWSLKVCGKRKGGKCNQEMKQYAHERIERDSGQTERKIIKRDRERFILAPTKI